MFTNCSDLVPFKRVGGAGRNKYCDGPNLGDTYISLAPHLDPIPRSSPPRRCVLRFVFLLEQGHSCICSTCISSFFRDLINMLSCFATFSHNLKVSAYSFNRNRINKKTNQSAASDHSDSRGQAWVRTETWQKQVGPLSHNCLQDPGYWMRWTPLIELLRRSISFEIYREGHNTGGSKILIYLFLY